MAKSETKRQRDREREREVAKQSENQELEGLMVWRWGRQDAKLGAGQLKQRLGKRKLYSHFEFRATTASSGLSPRDGAAIDYRDQNCPRRIVKSSHIDRWGSCEEEEDIWKAMSQNNLLQGYSWDSQFDDAQGQFTRSNNDEVISVYEVYVKDEETSGSDGRSEGSAASGVSGSTNSSSGNCPASVNEHQLIQRAIFKGDCMDLDAAIDSEIINGDGTVTKLLGKESLKYKILEQSISTGDQSVVVYPNQTISELEPVNPSATGPRLVDKDDPRSRLHFVKYLKRDGKTLKIWECGICSKEFRHQYTLMRHLPTHTDERNFKCDACGKAFRQLSTLSQHKAIHSDARPYVCEFCKKTFNRVSTLISHRKTHSELKPHKCHLCGKGFHQKGNLRNHVFTHTNERPYKCELCGKGFNQMSNLVCHKVKAHAHSERMQYSCGICGAEFPRRFSLRSHEEYKHGIKYRNPAGGIPSERTASQNSTSTSTCTSAAVSNTPSTCAAATSGAVDVTGPNVMRNKNVRVVESNEETKQQNVDDGQTEEYIDSIVIDKIDTKAMENAVTQGQTPFALLKPVKGIPVLVKVSPAGTHKHLLTPANADDLRMIGKMTLSPTLSADPDGLKAVQIKVPVVATITQHLDDEGKQSFTVEAPGPDQEHESLVAPLDAHFPFQESESTLRFHSASGAALFGHRDDDVDVDATTAATSATNSQSDDCSELLELAAQGGIQFVRATEDGRYEVMTNSEARDLMAQNSHDVTILDGDDVDALDIVNSRGQPLAVHEDLMIDDPESQIMLLDSGAVGNATKSIGLEGIEILEDKDIRIFDPKSLDDRAIDGMTFLSQMKLDDLILVPGKNAGGMDTVPVCPVTMTSPGAHDFASLVNNTQPMSINALLNKTQPSSLSIINDTMNYLRNCPARSLSDELKMFNEEEEEIQQHLEGLESLNEQQQQQQQQQQQTGIPSFNGKIKFSDFEELSEADTASLLTIGQQDVKLIGHQRSQNCLRIPDFYGNETRNYWDSQRNLPSFGEVKILGPRNQETEGSVIQLQDIRILGSYEQYLKSSAIGDSANFGQQQFSKSANNHAAGEQNPGATRKEVKILGKKLETGFLESNEDGNLVKIEDENEACRKMVSDVWEGWIERTFSANENRNVADDDDDEDDDDEKENDITYANIVDSEI